MGTTGWRHRLAAIIDRSGRSKRSISFAAGMGPGYLHSLLTEGKDPTIESLSKLCKEVGVSLSFIVHGYVVTAEQEEFSTASQRDAILTLLRPLNGGREE